MAKAHCYWRRCIRRVAHITHVANVPWEIGPDHRVKHIFAATQVEPYRPTQMLPTKKFEGGPRYLPYQEVNPKDYREFPHLRGSGDPPYTVETSTKRSTFVTRPVTVRSGLVVGPRSKKDLAKHPGRIRCLTPTPPKDDRRDLPGRTLCRSVRQSSRPTVELRPSGWLNQREECRRN